jgi:phage anti-repressor protein
MNEITNATDKTPIEVALQVGEDNTVSARNVYKFLELADGQFSRWSKKNILENDFAAENEDYRGFDINVEGNKTTDYKLSLAFAKKLCMASNTAKGEAARDYFVKVETKLKAIVVSGELSTVQAQKKQLTKELDIQVRMLNSKIRLAELHVKLSKHPALAEAVQRQHAQVASGILLERSAPTKKEMERTVKVLDTFMCSECSEDRKCTDCAG